MLRVIIASLCAALWAGAASAAQPQDKAGPAQLGGLIADQTVTAAGRHFYQSFSALWLDLPLNEQWNIAVRERVSARFGNRIQIEYANRTVFDTALPTARSNIKAISARAVEIAYPTVSNAAVQRLLFRELDLAGDEF